MLPIASAGLLGASHERSCAVNEVIKLTDNAMLRDLILTRGKDWPKKRILSTVVDFCTFLSAQTHSIDEV
jgi:hypothetical protein